MAQVVQRHGCVCGPYKVEDLGCLGDLGFVYGLGGLAFSSRSKGFCGVGPGFRILDMKFRFWALELRERGLIFFKKGALRDASKFKKFPRKGRLQFSANSVPTLNPKPRTLKPSSLADTKNWTIRTRINYSH